MVNETPITTTPKKEKSPRQRCIDGGGFWDAASKTCSDRPALRPKGEVLPSGRTAGDIRKFGQPGPTKLFLGGKEVTRKEFDKAKLVGGSPFEIEEEKRRAAEEPGAVSAQVTIRAEERAAERAAAGLPPEEAPIEEPGLEPGVTPGLLTEEEAAAGLTQEDKDAGVGIEAVGGVSPITSSDITDLLTMFSGLGFGRIAGKEILKGVGKGGLLNEVVIKKKVLNGVKDKLFGIIKSGTKKISGLTLALGVTTAVGVAGAVIAPFAVKRISAVDRQIQSLDTALSQVRESLTAPVQLVASGVPASEGLEILDDFLDQILETESKLKVLEIKSQEIKTNPEFTAGIKSRITKLKLFVKLSERQILRMDITGKVPTTEELAALMAQYETLLKD